MKNRSRLLRALAAGMLAVLCLVTMTGCTNNSTAAVSTQQNTASGATYQITLDPNGGAFVDGKTEPVTISVTEGTPIDFASYMPAYEGNTLYGWYMPDGMPWPGARKVSGNVSLKAKWDVAEVSSWSATAKRSPWNTTTACTSSPSSARSTAAMPSAAASTPCTWTRCRPTWIRMTAPWAVCCIMPAPTTSTPPAPSMPSSTMTASSSCSMTTPTLANALSITWIPATGPMPATPLPSLRHPLRKTPPAWAHPPAILTGIPA